MVVELGSRRPPPQGQHDDLEGRDLIGKREEEHDQFQPVMLAAGRQEDRLVAQSQQCQRDDRRGNKHRIDQTHITGGGHRPAVAG